MSGTARGGSAGVRLALGLWGPDDPHQLSLHSIDAASQEPSSAGNGLGRQTDVLFPPFTRHLNAANIAYT